MTLRHPMGDMGDMGAEGAGDVGWRLPDAVDLGLARDPFAEEGWREEENLGGGAARLIAARLREDAARYEAGA